MKPRHLFDSEKEKFKEKIKKRKKEKFSEKISEGKNFGTFFILDLENMSIKKSK